MDNAVLDISAYNGPLDLLDQLLRGNDYDLSKVSLVSICDQYTAALDRLKASDMEFLSEFLLMAATLIRIKSEYLLPKHENSDESAEKASDDLLFRLLRYRRCTMIAQALQQRQLNYGGSYFKPQETPERLGLQLKAPEKPLDFKRFELVLLRLLHLQKEKKPNLEVDFTKIIAREKANINEKICYIKSALQQQKSCSFCELFPVDQPKYERAAGFLAMLELVKLDEISIKQKKLFAPIHICMKVKHEK